MYHVEVTPPPPMLKCFCFFSHLMLIFFFFFLLVADNGTMYFLVHETLLLKLLVSHAADRELMLMDLYAKINQILSKVFCPVCL